MSHREKLEKLLLPFFRNSKRVKQILDYRQEILLLFDYELDQPTRDELNRMLVDLYIMFKEYLRPGKNYNTFQAIGLWLGGLSRERISQIEKRGIAKLKQPSLRQKFEDIYETKALFEKEKLMKSSERP